MKMVNDRYDVVVAGSGIGGLCAAALLAHRGYRVLLAEKRARLGGRFSTIEQDGFKTPTGAVAIQTRGVIERIFKEVGADFNVQEIGTTSAWLWGEWHQLPEKGQLRALLSLLEKTGSNRVRILGRLAQGAVTERILGAFRKPESRATDPASNLSFHDWLRQYTDDEKVLQVFHSLTSAISTVNDFEYPVCHWFTYVSSHGQGGLPYHGVSRRGNIELASSLADAVRRRNGDVWTNSPVTGIVIERGVVTRVVLSREGREVEVETDRLISDLGPGQTVALAGRSNFSDDYLAQVDVLRPAPIIASLVASDRPLTNAPGGLLVVGASRIVAGIPLTNFSRELAPPGQHLMVIWGTPASCRQKMNVEEELKLNLEDIRQVFPDFEKYGRILRVDVREIDDEFPALRSWMGYDMPLGTPVPNLYHVGDAVKPFGWEGLAACAQGARLVVDRIRKK